MHTTSTGLDLWQFSTTGAQASLQTSKRLPPDTALPPGSGPRGWTSLFQSKLNIAWLPSNQVFLRVVEIPPCAPEELPSILELQLEKISPLPVNQVVWTYEPVPGPSDQPQTLVVILAARDAVDQHLADVERQGFIPDRLELPLLHHVVAHRPSEDGTWLHLAAENDRMLCLTAWWARGQLRQLHLLQLPAVEPGPALLIQQLTHLAWAGEMEGWLERPPTWHLVVAPELAPPWESALRAWAGDAVDVVPGPDTTTTALLSATRGSRGETRSNLLPADVANRYRQVFVDRLWMQGLAGVLAVYLLGTALYFAGARYEAYRRDRVLNQITTIAPGYTNALTLKERVRVLEEQAGLKYAALDAWRVVSELLPAGLTLESFNFQGGDKLFLSGAVGTDNQKDVTQFNADLRKARAGTRLLFDEAGFDPPAFTPRGNNIYRWSFNAKLRTTWLE